MGAYDQYINSTGTHYISNSGHDERGTGFYTGGQAGDQTGGEWALISWYNRPWSCVLRYPDENAAMTIAELSCAAALNDNIGYNQDNRTSYWNQLQSVGYDPSKITTKCDDDCSAGVCANVKATGYLLDIAALKNIDIVSTHYMRSLFSSAGFQVLTDSKYTGGYSNLLPGDVLLNDSSHTAVNVTLSSGMSFNGVSGLTGSGVNAANLNYEVIDDYIITIDENTKNPDYASMQENRVCGVVIKAGCIWNSSHSRNSNVRNKYLQQQVESAEEVGMQYGFYWDCRAHTVEEADEEMYEVRLIIREHPPNLGMWLHLEMNQSVKQNNKIVDEYYKKLVDMGLKYDIGFYVTRKELEKITWEDYQDDWWLWLVDHVEDIDELNTFLDPTFFMLDEEKAAELKSTIYSNSSGTYNYGDTSATYTAEEDAIWDYLVDKLGNQYGAAGIMGNWQKESGFVAANLQNSYETSLGYTDQTYTEAVDSGTYTNFVNDAAGYGLAQWTYYTRKQSLYDFAKSRNTSIGCLSMQLDFFWEEIQGYSSTLSYLKSATSAYAASTVFLTDYEMPGGLASEEPERGGNAENIYKRHATTASV